MISTAIPAVAVSGPIIEALNRSRGLSHSYVECASSIWSLHDETFNIWTHLAAATLFAVAVVRSGVSRDTAPNRAKCTNLLYLTGAVVCFSLSTLYHMFANHVYAWFWQWLDHFGIAIYIWASSLTFSILCFAGDQTTQLSYSVVVSVLALLSLFRLQEDITHWDEVSWVRVSTHAIYGGLASLPALHCARNITRSGGKAQQQLLRSFGILVLLNTVGGLLYATEVTEQIARTKIGLVGTSHQAMHILSVAGAWTFKKGIHSFHHSRVMPITKLMNEDTTTKQPDTTRTT